MMDKQIIQTLKAPKAIGPYSQAVVINGGKLLFTAGQIPLNPETGEIDGEDIRAQTHQVMKNIKAILESAGSNLDQVVKTTVYLKNMTDFQAMNGVYAEYFMDDPPARSAVEVSRLPKNVLIEIECIACIE